jgi:hypothetical protein
MISTPDRLDLGETMRKKFLTNLKNCKSIFNVPSSDMIQTVNHKSNKSNLLRT